jgi:hypothetical protein
MAPTNTRGMTYQMKENHISNLTEYFVEGVNVAFNCLKRSINIKYHLYKIGFQLQLCDIK